jgi:16S rRNA (uracil1498-N3)-methyltransferase
MELRHTHRLYVSHKLAQGVTVPAADDQAHYIQHVLRLQTGGVLRLFNGRDGEYRAEVVRSGKKKVEFTIVDQLRTQQPEPDVWLCCAPIKKAHFDYMLEKSTELGVSEIQPVLTQRAQIREVNGDRAFVICREAAEQSERLAVPAVGNPVSLVDLIDVFPKDRALIVCAELGKALPIYEALRSVELAKHSKAAILTGPEGGFASEELDALRKVEHAFFVRLGPRILRADTAAIAALTCWQAIKGDWIEA